MPEPTPQSLLHLHNANIQHIAQMKEATRSLLRWTTGLTGSYLIAFRAAALDKYVPETFIAVASFVIFFVAAYSVIFILYTQKKLRDTRRQLHNLQRDLDLENYTDDTPFAIWGWTLTWYHYTGYWYGCLIWVPAALLCCVCAAVALWIGCPYIW